MKILNKIKMKDLEKIPDPIKNLLDGAAQEYATSTATTNAGFILRFICKFIKPSTIIKMFSHKLSK
jgi:hypothetical protein